MQRIRCEHNTEDPTGPCMTCKKVANTRAGRLPCLRYKITDVKLNKSGNVPGYEWTQRWTDNVPSVASEGWASLEVKSISLAEGYSVNVIQLAVRRFVPQAGDKINRTYRDKTGKQCSHSCTPYALVDLKSSAGAYQRYIERSIGQVLHNVTKEYGLVHKTYLRMHACAIDKSTPLEIRSLLLKTFMLWMYVRLTTKSVFIKGSETLGIKQLPKDSPDPDKVPVPPVLGRQLDILLMDRLAELRKEVLDGLEKLVSKKKHSTWFYIYLISFVLLHNTALITAHDSRYAKKHGIKDKNGMQVRFAREASVREYHVGANVLLAHFHYCNKGVYPFSDQCKDQDLRTLAGLNEDEILFVKATRQVAKQSKHDWEKVRARGDYENDWYFVSQLFEENWQPQSTI
ncbi:uncharacterized protein F5Z01DRAFT_692675 [Emericellopsis atlantica]|uniref:Uncharacterized protein n=1 Tax=Emericellopsis atlantica TaxID=2614577 RepID=A0A9P7ZU06_9HYPO|nr:uncharacterized protein F5Z01DRAFT_692675 [Emericellopsis atlantica]KAG9257811.1 hypothetical protein F5Z01DRAFT_692675 [Emericellopsis atlantica]